MIRDFLLLVCVLSASGCTMFTVETPQGVVIRQVGAPLVSRDDNFVIQHQWVGEDNALHEMRIERTTSENADQQARLVERAFDLGRTSVPTP